MRRINRDTIGKVVIETTGAARTTRTTRVAEAAFMLHTFTSLQ